MAHNVDDLLITGTNQNVSEPAKESKQPEPVISNAEDVSAISHETRDSSLQADIPEHKDELPEQKPEVLTSERKETDNKEVTNENNDQHIDEYGGEVRKDPKMYTQDEVNRMMRERFERGQWAQMQQQQAQQQPIQQQQPQQVPRDFEFDENSNVPWQQQLEQFVEHTYNKIAVKNLEQARAEKTAKEMAQFESKFQEGMGRYQDYYDVVQGKPLTDAMVLATKSLNDPAGFIYNASKHYSKELDRIAQLADPFSQAIEMGRLEERMRKNKPLTKAPAPIRSETGDIIDNDTRANMPSIEDRIAQYGRSKIR